MFGRPSLKSIPTRFDYGWGDFSLWQKASACLTAILIVVALFVWVPYRVPTGGGRIVYGWSWSPVEYPRDDELARDLAAAVNSPEFRREHPELGASKFQGSQPERASINSRRARNTALLLLACGVLSHVVIQIVENWHIDATRKALP